MKTAQLFAEIDGVLIGAGASKLMGFGPLTSSARGWGRVAVSVVEQQASRLSKSSPPDISHLRERRVAFRIASRGRNSRYRRRPASDPITAARHSKKKPASTSSNSFSLHIEARTPAPPPKAQTTPARQLQAVVLATRPHLTSRLGKLRHLPHRTTHTTMATRLVLVLGDLFIPDRAIVSTSTASCP